MERLKVFLPQHITHLFFGWWKEREGGFYVRCLKNADSVSTSKVSQLYLFLKLYKYCKG